MKVNLNCIGSSRSARDTRDPILRKEKEKRKKRREERGPTLESGLYDSIRNSLHFKALLSAWVEAYTHCFLFKYVLFPYLSSYTLKNYLLVLNIYLHACVFIFLHSFKFPVYIPPPPLLLSVFLTPCLLKMFILASHMPWCWHLCPCQAIELAAADKLWHIQYPAPQWLPPPGQALGLRTE